MTHTVSETLNKAADLIEERGWTTGPDGWAHIRRESEPLCLEGALMAASGMNRSDIHAFYTDCPAYDAVADYLDRDPLPRVAPISGALWQWNDSQNSAEEVIEVLRAAAVIEEAREAELAVTR
jgi:hypothetical protein